MDETLNASWVGRSSSKVWCWTYIIRLVVTNLRFYSMFKSAFRSPRSAIIATVVADLLKDRAFSRAINPGRVSLFQHGESQRSLSSQSRSDSGSSGQSMVHGGTPELFLGLAYNSDTGRLSVQVIKGSNFKNLAMSRAPGEVFIIQSTCCLVSTTPYQPIRTDRWLPLMPRSERFGGYRGWRGGVVACEVYESTPTLVTVASLAWIGRSSVCRFVLFIWYLKNRCS